MLGGAVRSNSPVRTCRCRAFGDTVLAEVLGNGKGREPLRTHSFSNHYLQLKNAEGLRLHEAAIREKWLLQGW